MITYNHEAYIKEALESVIGQEGDFTFEVILCDDCSKDSTQKEIEEVLNSHPNSSRIKYFRHESNIGMMPNFIFALSKCSGKYIALCDGDDYWTDSSKLKTQFDFLEKNSQYVAAFHNSEVIKTDGNGLFYNNKKTGKVTVEDIILKGGGVYPTASFFYRNIIDSTNFPKDSRAGDSILIFSLIEKGDIFYDNSVVSAYRKHVGGVFTSIDGNREKTKEDIISNIRILLSYNQKSQYKAIYKKAILKQIHRLSNRYSIFGVFKIFLEEKLPLYYFTYFYLKR